MGVSLNGEPQKIDGLVEKIPSRNGWWLGVILILRTPQISRISGSLRNSPWNPHLDSHIFPWPPRCITVYPRLLCSEIQGGLVWFVSTGFTVKPSRSSSWTSWSCTVWGVVNGNSSSKSCFAVFLDENNRKNRLETISQTKKKEGDTPRI